MPVRVEDLSEKELQVYKALSELAWMDKYPERPEWLLSISQSYARFVRSTDTHHEYLGDVNPLHWLIGEIKSTCSRFPKPIEARKIYEANFAPEDKRSAGELEDRIFGGS